MPVMARCRECGKQYRMRDELAGKVLPCKECGADFRVPRAGKPQPGRPKSGAAARPPRSPQARPKPKKNDFFENDDDSPGGGSALIWIIGGVSAVVVLAGVLIAVFAFRGNGDEEKKDKPDDSEKLAQNDEQNDEDREPPDNAGRNRRNNRNVIPPRNNNRNRQNNNRNNRNANKQPGGLQPPPRRVNLPPQIGNNQPNNGKGLPGGIIPPEKKKQKPVFGDSNAAGWRVAVDPPAQQVEFTNRDKKPIIAPGGTRADPLFPTTTSAFVALGSNRDVKSIRQVWDLRTKTKVGRIGGIKLFFSKGKLSPDGKHFAAMSKETKGIWLWDVAAEKQLGTLPLDEKTASRLKLPVLEFAGPNRLVAAGRGTPLWVWSIPDGKPERSLELPKGYETESLGFSHGGRYLTVYKREGFGKRSAIHAYDLTTGKEAGQLLMPKDIGLMHCRGTAFSPDGTELAALFEFTTKNRLFVWDVKTGRQLVHHSFRRASKHYKGPAVQWFPDKSKWLVYGNDVIDRKAGGPVWSVPKQPGASSGSPARLLGGDRIALFGSERGVSALAALEVPEDQLAKGAQVIKAGGTTSDVGLPPLRAAEYVGSRTIAVNGVAGRWSVQPDAANDPAGETLTGSMNLDSSFGKVMGALLARRDVAQALVVSHAAGRFGRLPDGDGKTPLVRLDRYDLVNRKLVDSLSLTYPADLLAFSPSGKRALLRYKKGEDRVDCWSLEEKKPVIGWRPYSKERFSHYKKVNAAVFVDDDHVLTLNGRNKLVLWKLPDCTAVYVMENVSKPGLSPNGRYLTVAAGNSFRMFDARTGDAVGDVTFSGTPQAAAFHPNGERFAAVYTDAEGTKLGVWDLTTGKSGGSFPLPTSARSMHWCGDGYVLLDDRRLVDLKHKMVVWNYALAGGIHVPQSPDGKHWYLSAQQPVTLTAASLPEPDVGRRLADKDLAPKFLLKPGMKVTLSIALKGISGHPNITDEIVNDWTRKLQSRGIEVAAGQPIVLFARSSLENTGKTHQFSRSPSRLGFGPRFGSRFGKPPAGSRTESVSGKVVKCRIVFGINGKSYGERIRDVKNVYRGMRVTVKKDESVQSKVDKQQANSAAGFFRGYSPPGYLFDNGAENGLGTSQLLPGGARVVGSR